MAEDDDTPEPLAVELVRRVARVQELCEALARLRGGERFLVTFNDGSTAELSTVLAEGRDALAEVAAFFEVDVPEVAKAIPPLASPGTEAGHGG